MTWPTYLSFDIFDRQPNWAQAVETPFIHSVQVLQDLGIGAAWSNFDQTIMGLKAEYLLTSKADIDDLVDFFKDKMGKWAPFWVPTWQADVVLADAVGATDTTIIIEDIDYDAYFGEDDATGRHLFFYFPDGTYVCRKVLSWTTQGPTGLILANSLAREITEDELNSVLVSFLNLSRFDTDDLELKYVTDCLATTILSFRAVPHESPV